MTKSFLHTIYLKQFAFFIFFTMFSVTSFAQVKFYARTNANEIFQGSYFQVEFTIENNKGDNFTPPDFEGFKVISGPNRSSSYSFINGISKNTITFSYTLLALKTGTFTIKPAKLTFGNKVYKTKSLRIKVVEKPVTKSNNSGKDFLVKMELSDSTVYTGQQIVLKYNLYTTKNISSYSFRSESGFDNFDIYELNNNLNGFKKILGDIQYTVFTIKRLVLFPQKAGKYDIEPAYIDLQIPDKRSRNIFFNSVKTVNIHTNPATITVKSLPSNPPENFSGNTGKFEIRIQTNKKKISTDDAFALKLYITSDNPLDYIEAPKIEKHLKDFEIYDPKVVGQRNYEQNGNLKGKKTFEYLIVPQKPGKYTIKIPYTYFDTDSSKYLTIWSNPVNITIVQGKTNQTSKAIIEKYKLKPLMTDKALSQHKSPFLGSFWFWTILGILVLSILFMYLYKRHLIKQSNTDPVILKRKKAAKIALLRLKTAKKYKEENNFSAFYKEISDALLKYIADKLNIPTIELSKENIKTKLLSLNVPQTQIEEYIKLLEDCEIALYAANPGKNMHDVYEKAVELLTKMEISIKK